MTEGKTFIDTNIIVYANDKKDPVKQQKAITIVKDFMDSGFGVLSTQVLQEYAVTGLRKLNQRRDVIIRNLVLLESMEVVLPTPKLVQKAVELRELYQISFWDACIIAQAESAECETILSEDLDPGQFYSGIRLVNPFL